MHCLQNLFSIEKLLSSKCHMITCSKRDRLHVRPKMSGATKCNTKTPRHTPPLTSQITGQLVSEYNRHFERQDAWVAWCHQLSAPPEVVYYYLRQVSQQLPAPYKRLIDEIKQKENDRTADNLTNNRRLFNCDMSTINRSKRTNYITSLHSQ